MKNDDERAAAANDGIGIGECAPLEYTPPTSVYVAMRDYDGAWGDMLSTGVPATGPQDHDEDNKKIARHYGEVKYHNSRVLEEVVHESPADMNKDALRMALGPIIVKQNDVGGFVNKEELLFIRNLILIYDLKVKGRVA